MKIDKVRQLLEDPKIKKGLLLPGFVTVGNRPIKVVLPIEQEAAGKLFIKILETLGSMGIEVEEFDFHFSFSGDQMLFLFDSTWPKTLH